jgi:hypothetical protein
MTSPDQHLTPSGGPRRRRVVVRNAADLNRLAIHLATHWTLPRIEISTEAFAALDVQRTQDRVARLSEACNCLLGEMLATATLLLGLGHAWTTSKGWDQVGWVILAALGAGLVGKALNIAWTRVKLLRAVRRLRSPSGTPGDFAEAEAARHARIEARIRHDVRGERAQRPEASRAEPTPSVLLRNAADIDATLMRVITSRTLPRIQVGIDGLPELEAQQVQHRIVHLSRGCNCVLGAVLAAVTLLVGGLYVVWSASSSWFPPQSSWSPAGLLLISVLGAGLIGWAIETGWTRLRLLRVLQGLRSQLHAS